MDNSMDPRRRIRMRPRMSLADRAKIFMPFDPLKGFREALREKEIQAQEATKTNDPFDEQP